MIDTRQAREPYDVMSAKDAQTLNDLCDEIDNLRSQNSKLLTDNEYLNISLTTIENMYKQERERVDSLEEQLKSAKEAIVELVDERTWFNNKLSAALRREAAAEHDIKTLKDQSGVVYV
jgi:chromosome segregation ATPase